MGLVELIRKIKSAYGNTNYVAVSEDKYYEKVSPELYKLWYSLDVMSIATIDTYYHRIGDMAYPEYSAEKFEADAQQLESALMHEFALIIKGANNSRKEETDYERT